MKYIPLFGYAFHHLNYSTFKYIECFNNTIEIEIVSLEDGETISDSQNQIFNDFLENQIKIKEKIDEKIFEEFKEGYKQSVKHYKLYQRDDYENFERYKKAGSIKTYKAYKKLGISTFEEVMNEWEQIKKCKKIESKRQKINNLLKLEKIKLFNPSEKEDKGEIAFGFEEVIDCTFDPHGFGIVFSNWEIFDTGQKYDITG